MSSRGMSDTQQTVIANGQEIAVELPLSLQRFLEAQGMPPRSVVVELNSEAVSPSEFSERQLQAGDTMEIVRVVAGG
jgi:thiamine biosynthesis protein ThiS